MSGIELAKKIADWKKNSPEWAEVKKFDGKIPPMGSKRFPWYQRAVEKYNAAVESFKRNLI